MVNMGSWGGVEKRSRGGVVEGRREEGMREGRNEGRKEGKEKKKDRKRRKEEKRH